MTAEKQAQTSVGRGGGRRGESAVAHMLFWPLAAGGLGLDLWSKKAVFERLGPHDIIQVIPGCLRLATALNDGAAFSLAKGRLAVLVAIAGVALVVVLGLFLFGGKKPPLTTVVLGLFAGGVAGNLWDRLFNQGHVRDFIDVYVGPHHWPIFNVADMLLCIAVGLLLIGTLGKARTSRPPRRDR